MGGGAVQVCRCCADSHSHYHMISGLPVQSNESPSDLCHSVHLPADSFHPALEALLPVQCVAHCVDRTLNYTLLLQLLSLLLQLFKVSLSLYFQAVGLRLLTGCCCKLTEFFCFGLHAFVVMHFVIFSNVMKQMSCVTLRGRHTQLSHTLSNVSSSLRSAAVSGHQVQSSRTSVLAPLALLGTNLRLQGALCLLVIEMAKQGLQRVMPPAGWVTTI